MFIILAEGLLQKMDLKITNALIFDGLGGIPFSADILVKDDKIAGIGNVEADFPEYNAKGKILCPGFVDIHRHADVKPLTNWNAEAELRQGICTMVVGNCGISLTPSSNKTQKEQYAFAAAVLGNIPLNAPQSYADYIKSLSPLPVNFSAMVGTGSVRISLKGFADSPFTPAKLDAAEREIEAALALGAPGISAGIMYTPECFTSFDEFVRILRPLGKYNRVLTVHIRGEGDSLAESVSEAISIARAVGCPLEISHFKSCGITNWNREIYRAIQLIEDARSSGMDLSCDFYPYCGGSTMLTTMLPPVLCENGIHAACRALGTRDGLEAFCRSVSRLYDNWDNYAISLGWDRVIVSSLSLEENKKYLGLSISRAADKFGFSCPEALAAHLMHTEGGGCGIIIMSMSQPDVDAIARLPYSMLISDALYAETDTPHPRLLGAFPRFLREYAFERKVISPQEAIKKMSYMPAGRMGFPQRGRIEKGCFADLLVFDPKVFTDNADFSGNSSAASGLSLAMVNGEIALKDDCLTGSLCGSLLLKNKI